MKMQNSHEGFRRVSYIQRTRNYHNNAEEKKMGNDTTCNSVIDAIVKQSASALERFPGIIRPILDAIAKATKGKLVLLWGGPEPGDDGRLNILRYSFSLPKSSFLVLTRTTSMCAGNQNFINSNKEGYIGMDCQAMALPAVKGPHEVGFGEVEYKGVLLHRVDDANTISRTSAASPSFRIDSVYGVGKEGQKGGQKIPTTSSTAAAPSTTPSAHRRLSNGSAKESPFPRTSIVASPPPLSPLSATPMTVHRKRHRSAAPFSGFQKGRSITSPKVSESGRYRTSVEQTKLGPVHPGTESPPR
ncbi:hypothetical protein DFS33DRAFT_1456228 [Desarmillaria ectypa]|nr:hypothetical protein DFS33DRAFT_1456228 [Desarmillaria ectypa]